MQQGGVRNQCEVIVINPELEVWILQDNPNVEQAFRFKQNISLREWLRQKGLWDSGELKSVDPKKAVEAALKFTRTPRSSAIYKNVTSQVSIKGCVNPAFQKLCHTLKRWFSVNGG